MTDVATRPTDAHTSAIQVQRRINHGITTSPRVRQTAFPVILAGAVYRPSTVFGHDQDGWAEPAQAINRIMLNDHSLNRAISRRRLVGLGFALLGVGLSGRPVCAWTTEKVVLNPDTGIAIEGFDPVSYFQGQAPRLGDSALQFDWSGATWFFANEGNLEAFKRDPEVYAPRFGGHCCEAAARNLAVDGDPALFRRVGRRLYLFSDATAVATFDLAPTDTIRRAEEYWPMIARKLSG
jgi:YHS domain-containing protein